MKGPVAVGSLSSAVSVTKELRTRIKTLRVSSSTEGWFNWQCYTSRTDPQTSR
jgi:hypothetical protein